jgi:lycopene beta-cyclase
LLKNQEISEVAKLQNQSWRIVTNNQTFTADKIVDTRPHVYAGDGDSLLWQSFLGHEVETDEELFEANTFVLMDFDETFTDGLGFVYILPYSNKRALIEYTVFSEKPLLAKQLDGYINLALSRNLKDVSYKTLRTEYGKLPMGYQNKPHSVEPNYIYAGLFAGSARPSSGYAFQRIQSWANRCASTYLNNQTLSHPPKDPIILMMMDDIFLNVLKSNPKSSIKLFFNLFSKCKPDAMIRFLSDHAKLSDYLSIIFSMPKTLFLKELPFYFYKRWIRNSRE